MQSHMTIRNFIWALVVFVVVGLSILFIPTQNNEPQYVSGNGHIYKGQKLDPNWHIYFVELSARGSWLNSTQYINVKMKDDLEAMIDAAEQDGFCIVVTSAYRNPEKQQLLYNSAEDPSTVALPMESEHQTGLAVDLTGCPMNEQGIRDDSVERLDLRKPFELQREYSWLLFNAEDYNFEESFTVHNEDVTGFPAEPWHWKYIIRE